MDRAFVNTVLGLCGGTVSTFVMSRLLRGKFDMEHIQNATLAGGVAVGAAADLYLHPSGAIAVGIVAGILSVLGDDFVTPWMDHKLGISDTCGVHNLHGMPGVLGGIVSAIAIGATGSGVYVDEGADGYPFTDHSFSEQAGLQIAGIIVTLSMAILGGTLTGVVLTHCGLTRPQHAYCDVENFEVPEGEGGHGEVYDNTKKADVDQVHIDEVHAEELHVEEVHPDEGILQKARG